MRKQGVINCLKKYRDIQEFKFGELVGVDKFGNRYVIRSNQQNYTTLRVKYCVSRACCVLCFCVLRDCVVFVARRACLFCILKRNI